MVISASRRTDIPCLYADWLAARVREGVVNVRNPYNSKQVRAVSLLGEQVDCLVLWSANPAPLLPHLPLLDACYGRRYYLQFSLLPYGRDLRPRLPDLERLEETFLHFSHHLGPERVVWRYDPILLQGELTEQWHEQAFARTARRLQGASARCVISFVDPYGRGDIRPVEQPGAERLARSLASIGKAHGFTLSACCEPFDLMPSGVAPAACIDAGLIEALCGAPLRLKRDANQRPGCNCAQSVDIGAYNTCTNGCVYCYAVKSADLARRNAARHDPQGRFLIP